MPVLALINRAKVPIKIWSPVQQVEPDAINQLINTANLPFVFKHVAAMPDVHLGKGATVGSVVATKGAIIPAAVGVDIGCGMMAVKTPLDHQLVLDKAGQIRSAIEDAVPVGFASHATPPKSNQNWQGWKLWDKLSQAGSDNYLRDKAQRQLGTLGGGNHFIEVCLDTQQAVWVMLHSGSRNVGKTLAERHINEAKGIMKKALISLPDQDLAYFTENQPQFRDYLNDVLWAQEYAFRNRQEMMSQVLNSLSEIIYQQKPIPRLTEVNCHHNYVAEEVQFDERVWVTRKGAVRAENGDLGIIPGSMGAKSFIVRGKGSLDSFNSCSHGAGRRMSRTQAKKQYTIHDLADQTAGVECRKDRGVLDEIPGAYKDIEEVMRNQADLVDVVAELKQILCVKG